MQKKFFALLFFTFMLPGMSLFWQRAYAALEVQYPNLPLFGAPNTIFAGTFTFGDVMQFLVILAFWVTSIMLLVNVFYAGFLFVASGANAEKKREARDRLARIIMGGFLLLGSFLILKTIDPQLINGKNLSFGICGGALPACPLIQAPTLPDITGGTPSGGPPPPPPGGCPTPPTCAPPPGCQPASGCLPPPQPLPSGSFTFFCQGDTRWVSQPYDGGNIGNSGCGPTALSMILYAKGGVCGTNVCTPDIVASMITNGQVAGMDAAGLVYFGNIGASARSFGLNAQQIPLTGASNNPPDIGVLQNFLNNGALILGSSSDFPCPNMALPREHLCSHLFVIDKIIDVNRGIIEIRDPDNCQYGTANSQEGAEPQQEPQRYHHNPSPGAAQYKIDAFPWVAAAAFQR